MNSKPQPYLAPSPCVNSDDRLIVERARELCSDLDSDIEKAIALYYFVRDTFSYNPYTASVDIESLQATKVLEVGEGWCVSKAVLLAALCRAAGISARLGFADVVNHLSTEKLRKTMNTDVFYFHGYCSIYLNERWVKATPAFNLSLCEKFNLQPLEFDGLEDSLYHPFDRSGNRHMEYIHERGEHLDVPIDEMRIVFEKHYPDISESSDHQNDAELEENSKRWQEEVEQEVNLQV